MHPSVSHFWVSGFGLLAFRPIPGMHKLHFWNKDSYVSTAVTLLFSSTQVFAKANAREGYLWSHSSLSKLALPFGIFSDGNLSAQAHVHS